MNAVDPHALPRRTLSPVTSSRNPDWVVVIASPGDFRPRELAQVLARARGVPLVDAAMAVRRAGGILLERTPRADAEALVALLAREGIAAKAGYAAALSSVPDAVVLEGAAPGAGGLAITGRGHGARTVPWGRVRLLALGAWPEERVVGTRTVAEPPSAVGIASTVAEFAVGAATGIPIFQLHGRRTREEPVVKSETCRVLDILLRDPDERLRIPTDDFDWSGLGVRKQYTSLPNCRAFVEEILRFAPEAHRNQAVELLLAGGRLSSADHDSSEAFEREERWLLSVLPE
jgi:hypothetical protein